MKFKNEIDEAIKKNVLAIKVCQSILRFSNPFMTFLIQEINLKSEDVAKLMGCNSCWGEIEKMTERTHKKINMKLLELDAAGDFDKLTLGQSKPPERLVKKFTLEQAENELENFLRNEVHPGAPVSFVSLPKSILVIYYKDKI